MTALLTTVFIASLIGSLHCAGMCGGLVTLCVSGQPLERRHSWQPHALYNLGRLATYATLGAASGALGAAIDLGGETVGWTSIAALVAGGAMILIGGAALLGSAGIRLRPFRLPQRPQLLLQRAMAATRRLPPGWQPLLIGLLTGLLPCGWLYAFVISAAATGNAMLGALTMTVFWAGTLPIMLALGVGLQRLAGPLRRHVPRLTAAALVVVGVVTVLGRLQVPAYAGAASIESVSDSREHIQSLDHSELPCCHDDASN